MKKFLKSPLAEGILFIIVGLILLFFPNGTLYLVCRIIGVALLVLAAYKIYIYASGKNGRQPIDLIIGIALAIFAIILLANPSFLTNFAPVLAGIVIAAGGIISLIRAFTMKQAGSQKVPGLVAAALTLGLGLLLLFQPQIITGIFVSVFGIALIAEGLSLILTGQKLFKK